MPTGPAIRPRRDDDLSTLANVLVRVHAYDGYPVEGVADPEAWLQHPRELRSWTADIAGFPAGQITLITASAEDDAARVWHEHTGGDIDRLAIPARLFVDPDHRGTGTGLQLIRTAVRYAHSLGRSVAFDVMEKDSAAIRVYERMGAVRLRSVTHHHGGGLTEPAAVFMVPSPANETPPHR
ncbi:GNAT family N-acetyltransferase [Haloechinothrix sp. LS1_15]|uniref:GNAT family N-acetyltransferase n=1 Tax=Haloechinothrix sp. LS1_15 TaxID=2652248 RepID=UPI002947BD6D|nr:GNAT family N-acetyltransferase [Haloechinothrix sp. LS1_15]MDV6014103.1 GNAT family N-acetyltransferase [Haloechinothrix sp. LS1_15]